MERVLELLQQFFQQQIVLIILVVLLVITIIVLYRKNKEVKKLINELEILEVDLTRLKVCH